MYCAFENMQIFKGNFSRTSSNKMTVTWNAVSCRFDNDK